MPICKNCHARISKFDKDICPVCGCQNPLDGVSSDTVEITSNIDMSKAEFGDYKPKSKAIALIFFALLGFTGAPFFYLGKIKNALICLFISLIFIGGLGSILAFPIHFNIALSYVIPLGATYLFFIVFGIAYLSKSNVTDSKGEFLR